MPFADTELPVRPSQLLQERDKPASIVLASYDMSQGREEASSLQVHGRRKHSPDFGIQSKKLGVEVCHCRVSGAFERPE
jgi:hypothetical protein